MYKTSVKTLVNGNIQNKHNKNSNNHKKCTGQSGLMQHISNNKINNYSADLCRLDQGLSMRDDDPDSLCASRNNFSSE